MKNWGKFAEQRNEKSGGVSGKTTGILPRLAREPQSRAFGSVVKPAQDIITPYFGRRLNADQNNRKYLSMDNMPSLTNGNSVENVSIVRYAK
jgi:hypothetical protein